MVDRLCCGCDVKSKRRQWVSTTQSKCGQTTTGLPCRQQPSRLIDRSDHGRHARAREGPNHRKIDRGHLTWVVDSPLWLATWLFWLASSPRHHTSRPTQQITNPPPSLPEERTRRSRRVSTCCCCVVWVVQRRSSGWIQMRIRVDRAVAACASARPPAKQSQQARTGAPARFVCEENDQGGRAGAGD